MQIWPPERLFALWPVQDPSGLGGNPSVNRVKAESSNVLAWASTSAKTIQLHPPGEGPSPRTPEALWDFPPVLMALISSASQNSPATKTKEALPSLSWPRRSFRLSRDSAQNIFCAVNKQASSSGSSNNNLQGPRERRQAPGTAGHLLMGDDFAANSQLSVGRGKHWAIYRTGRVRAHASQDSLILWSLFNNITQGIFAKYGETGTISFQCKTKFNKWTNYISFSFNCHLDTLAVKKLQRLQFF